MRSVIAYQSQTTRTVKTGPPCMCYELEDRKSSENHVIDLGKMAFDVTNNVTTP